MHMADALLSPAVGATMWAISTVSNGYGIKKITDSQLWQYQEHLCLQHK